MSFLIFLRLQSGGLYNRPLADATYWEVRCQGDAEGDPLRS
jgi:hypothetical protein